MGGCLGSGLLGGNEEGVVVEVGAGKGNGVASEKLVAMIWHANNDWRERREVVRRR